jgi:hypothetical protein
VGFFIKILSVSIKFGDFKICHHLSIFTLHPVFMNRKLTFTSTFLAIVLFLFYTIDGLAQNKSIKKPFPKEIGEEIYFGMPIEQFYQDFADVSIERDNSMDFRTVLSYEVGKKKVTDLVLYFDNDGTMPLYEIIVIYSSEEKALNMAADLLGKPNFNGTEWRFLYKDLPLWCWVYKNKIVYAAKVAGSEWEEEWDGQ